MNRLTGALPVVCSDSRDQRSDDERFSSPMIGIVPQVPVQSLVMYEATKVWLGASKLLSICDLRGSIAQLGGLVRRDRWRRSDVISETIGYLCDLCRSGLAGRRMRRGD